MSAIKSKIKKLSKLKEPLDSSSFNESDFINQILKKDKYVVVHNLRTDVFFKIENIKNNNKAVIFFDKEIENNQESSRYGADFISETYYDEIFYDLYSGLLDDSSVRDLVSNEFSIILSENFICLYKKSPYYISFEESDSYLGGLDYFSNDNKNQPCQFMVIDVRKIHKSDEDYEDYLNSLKSAFRLIGECINLNSMKLISVNISGRNIFDNIILYSKLCYRKGILSGLGMRAFFYSLYPIFIIFRTKFPMSKISKKIDSIKKEKIKLFLEEQIEYEELNFNLFSDEGDKFSIRMTESMVDELFNYEYKFSEIRDSSVKELNSLGFNNLNDVCFFYVDFSIDGFRTLKYDYSLRFNAYIICDFKEDNYKIVESISVDGDSAIYIYNFNKRYYFNVGDYNRNLFNVYSLDEFDKSKMSIVARNILLDNADAGSVDGYFKKFKNFLKSIFLFIGGFFAIYFAILVYCDVKYETTDPCTAAAQAIGRSGDTVVSMIADKNTSAGAVARFSREVFGVNPTSERQLVSGFAHAATVNKSHLVCMPIIIGMGVAEEATISLLIEYLESKATF